MSGESSSMPPEAQRPLPKELGIQGNQQEGLPTGSAAVAIAEDILRGGGRRSVNRGEIESRVRSIRNVSPGNFYNAVGSMNFIEENYCLADTVEVFNLAAFDNGRAANCFSFFAPKMVSVVNHILDERATKVPIEDNKFKVTAVSLDDSERTTLVSFFSKFTDAAEEVGIGRVDEGLRPLDQVQLGGEINDFVSKYGSFIESDAELRRSVGELIAVLLPVFKEPGAESSLNNSAGVLKLNDNELQTIRSEREKPL